MKLATGRRPDPIIDLTPMIDVVFQLVLFFMVSTTFKTAPAIQVDLPRSSPDEVVTDAEDIHLWITAVGEIFLNDQPVELDQLQAAFGVAAAARPETLVVIKADRGAAHGVVVTAMDLARSRGLSRLAIATDPSADDGAGADSR